MKPSIALFSISIIFGVTGLLAYLHGAPDTAAIIGTLNGAVFGSAAIILREMGR